MENNDYYLETIDIGKYIEALLRQWRLIISTTLVCAFIAGLVSVLLPKNYETRALVSSTRQISTVSFGSNIETLSEEELEYTQRDYSSRMNSYVSMVKNPTIAEQVISDLGDKMPSKLQEIGELLENVEGELVSQSDSIAIEVTCNNPVWASEIANTWAKYYVEHLNSIYAESANEEVALAVQSQVELYHSNYKQSQAELEEFLTSYRANELQRQVTELQTILDNLQNSQTKLLNTSISKMIEHDLNIVDNYFSAAAQNQLYILSEYNQRYYKLGRLTSLLDVAENMREQIQQGGASAAQSNALALMILKMEAFSVYVPQGMGQTDQQMYENHQSYTGNELPNIELQTNLETLTPEQMISDLDSLISVLTAYQVTLEEELKTLSQDLASTESEKTELEVLAQQIRKEGALATIEENLQFAGVESLLPLEKTDSPLQIKIASLEQQIRDIESELEDIWSQKRELTKTRDLNWQTYQDLKTKSAELDVSANTANRAVTLAVTAPVPIKDSVNEAKNTALVAVIALILSIIAVSIIEFWWNYKDIEPTPITWKIIMSRREE